MATRDEYADSSRDGSGQQTKADVGVATNLDLDTTTTNQQVVPGNTAWRDDD